MTIRYWRYWTEKDLQLLKENYERGSKEELLKLFPQRTWGAIKLMAEKNNLKRQNVIPISVISKALPERLCILCSNFYKPRAPQQKYCPVCMPPKFQRKEYDKKLYQLHIEKNRATALRYKHTENGRINHAKRIRKDRERWGYLSEFDNLLAKDIELFGIKILKEEGYTNIYDINEIYPTFPFDLVATSPTGERIVIIDVTSSLAKGKLIKKTQLSLLLDLKPYLLFIKPDKTNYWLTPIPYNRKSITVPAKYHSPNSNNIVTAYKP